MYVKTDGKNFWNGKQFGPLSEAVRYVSDTPLRVLKSPYRVKPGDTLTRIARLLDTTVSHLAKRNFIRNPNLIYPGQEIYK